MKRRGIGNVIASAVMVFLIIFTVSQLYVYNINQLDNYNQVAQAVFNTNAQKQNEHIIISNAAVHPTLATTKVDLTVTNTGGVTAQIASIWMSDVIFSSSPHARVPENVFLGPGLSTTIAGVDTGVLSSLNHQILVKVYTALGTSASVELLPPGEGGTTTLTTATTQLTLIPPNPITSNDIVVILTVTNTNSLGLAFTSLTPDICVVHGSFQPTISTMDSGTATDQGSNTLTDGTKRWTSGQWIGNLVYITAGTGAGQTARITSNSATQLTVNPPWLILPDATSSYIIRTDCHGSKPTLDSGRPTSPSVGNTLIDATRNWAKNQWTNYMVNITSGAGAGESAIIAGNTATQLTVTPAWSVTPDSSSQYAIRAPNCSSGTGATLSEPVSCSLVQGPSPPSLNFLPPGGTIQFQWIYLINSIVPDSPITFAASYVNTSTTIGLITSPLTQNQIPFETAVVRGAGGASSSSGGTFASALGQVQIQYSSTAVLLRSSKTDTGPWPVSCSPPCVWSSSLQVSKTSFLTIRVNVTNTGSTPITLSANTAVYAERLTVPQFVQFYIVYPTFSSGQVTIGQYGGSSIVTLPPGKTTTLYFAVGTAGGSPSINNQAVSFGNTDTYLCIIGLSGTLPSSNNYSQAIPFVAVITT